MQERKPIRVLVVDDHRVVRESLRSYLDIVDDVEMVGEASDGGSALDWLARAKAEDALPDVVLMDLMMQPMGAIEATAAIKDRYMAAVRIGTGPLTAAAMLSKTDPASTPPSWRRLPWATV